MILIHLINNVILTGLAIFPVLAMFLFLLLFIGIIIYTFTADKKNMDSWSNIPIEEEEALNQEKK